jgi:hypothetical protein
MVLSSACVNQISKGMCRVCNCTSSILQIIGIKTHKNISLYFLLPISSNSFRRNYSFFEFLEPWKSHIVSALSFLFMHYENFNSFIIRVQKLFKDGNYSREETICGNRYIFTICTPRFELLPPPLWLIFKSLPWFCKSPNLL